MKSPVLVEKSAVEINAPRDWTLHGSLFRAANPVPGQPVILMSSAAGVPHGYYDSFCKHLVEQGAAAVLSYDYRGMSSSAGDRKRWSDLRMYQWAELDFPAAAEYLQTQYPGHPLHGMGHSYGGQAVGLSGAASKFERYATVATMSGYWGALDTPYSVWFLTQIIARTLVATLGYVPKGWGLGEAFPGSIMRDWCNWIADKNYWFDKKDVPGLDNFAKVTLPYLSIGVRDDPWGTELAISNFMQHYTNADFQQIWVSPGESGKIGHLGYFRPRHREYHWSVCSDFLLPERN